MMRSLTEIVGHFIPYKAKATILKHPRLMEEGKVIERVEVLIGRYRVFYRPKLPGPTGGQVGLYKSKAGLAQQ